MYSNLPNIYQIRAGSGLPRESISISVYATRLIFDLIKIKLGSLAVFYSALIGHLEVAQGIVMCKHCALVPQRLLPELHGHGPFHVGSSNFKKVAEGLTSVTPEG